MKVMVVDERKELIREPYVVRLGGWTLERYLREAPEHARWEFAYGEVVVYSPVVEVARVSHPQHRPAGESARLRAGGDSGVLGGGRRPQ